MNSFKNRQNLHFRSETQIHYMKMLTQEKKLAWIKPFKPFFGYLQATG